jgi:RNA polymerase sigma-70 factor (ECF subfamily)
VQWEDEVHAEALEAGGTAENPESETQHLQESDMLLKALDRLPVEKRDLLLLSRMQGLKHTEIAEVLGCPVTTVRVRVHRALLDLRAAFAAVSREGAR